MLGPLEQPYSINGVVVTTTNINFWMFFPQHRRHDVFLRGAEVGSKAFKRGDIDTIEDHRCNAIVSRPCPKLRRSAKRGPELHLKGVGCELDVLPDDDVGLLTRARVVHPFPQTPDTRVVGASGALQAELFDLFWLGQCECSISRDFTGLSEAPTRMCS